MSDNQPAAPIIIRRPRKGGHGHHGGAWKVAYADFVTSMMAFFLVMWIAAIGTKQQKAAISAYFKNPSATPGTASVAPPGMMGPGGASNSMIQLGGAMDLPRGPGKDRNFSHATSPASSSPPSSSQTAKLSKQELAKRAQELDKKRLEELKVQLHAAIQKSQALAPFKDQLLLDITPEGLRVQIVDKRNRPMFDLGSARLKDYTRRILEELAKFINHVPNRISIVGHTDDAPYGNAHGFSNWELSADRANAARRALLAGGLSTGKIARVVGLAATVPLDKANPANPINRRISIIVMTKAAEAALSKDVVDTTFHPADKPKTAAAQPSPATQGKHGHVKEASQAATPGNGVVGSTQQSF